MATSYFMNEEDIEFEGAWYRLMALVQISETEPSFSVSVELKSNNRSELNLEVKFRIENPIWIDDVIIYGASYYGLCIAGKITTKTFVEAMRCYRESRRVNPNLDLLGHAKETGRCLAGKGDVMKDTVTAALIECVPASLAGNNDDDD